MTEKLVITQEMVQLGYTLHLKKGRRQSHGSNYIKS